MFKEGAFVKIIRVDCSKIHYRDWLCENNPDVGDIAEITGVFDLNGETVYRIFCNLSKGNPKWGIDIGAPNIELENVNGYEGP